MNPVEKLSGMLLKKDEKKAALIFSPHNRRYFTGFPSSLGALLVTVDEAFLLMDFRYAEAAGYKAKNCKVVSFEAMGEAIEKLIKEKGIQEVFVELENLSLSQAKRFAEICEKAGAKTVESTALDEAIRELRMIKTEDEIKKLKRAQEITDAAFSHILPYIKPGVTELELALEIEFYMRKNGAEGISFDLIVVAGANGSQCHGVPSENVVKNGDFITMDTGAMFDGYHADMTRTVALGHVSDEQRTVYETVLTAHLEAAKAVKPGAVCSDIDKVARDIIEKDYSGCFGHGLGHGVGVEIHEWPRFSKLDSTVCAPGMVITNEPGIYLPGRFGVRIEDMLLVTESGCESLTKSPKELIVL